LGESVAFPCYSRIFAELPQQYRGRANALLDAGTKLGPAVGTFVGGMLLIHFGWRILFIALGLGGLLWLGPWFKFMPRPRPKQASKSEPLPPISLLLRNGPAWGTFLGHFCGLYFFYFLLAWLPSYLAMEMKLSLLAMTHLTSTIFLVIASSTLTTGWLSDHLIAKGASPTRVRKTIVVCGLSVASSILLLAFLRGNLTASISVLLVACIGYGAYSSNHWAISQTLAGPAMAGRWGSVQNGVGNLAGIAAPWLAGLAVQIRGNSSAAFFLAGVMVIVGAVIWGYMVPRVEQVQWNTSPNFDKAMAS
jgi:MFS family permease